jgi:hypothetical protein
MIYEEITPHLHKIVVLNLKNKKRKVGWLVVDECATHPIKEIQCVNVHYGRRFIHLRESIDPKEIRPHSEMIAIEEILNIRSSI